MVISIEKEEIIPTVPKYERKPSEHTYWMVFEQVVKPGAKARIMSQPDTHFKGKRLTIDPTVAKQFTVEEIRVGNCAFHINNSENGAMGTLFPPIPHELTESERADYEALLNLNLPVASPSQMILIAVKNISKEPALFNAVLWGINAYQT